ncbi:hypothetical protein BMETH_1766_0 [methanotrophic bacterial endosymbiont of Bathymodiolus sp.]|nr:hypothetical protein BMETH_1766_0 [methanotrophic bacterial endosymbiont of Bathymodiolus sp.]
MPRFFNLIAASSSGCSGNLLDVYLPLDSSLIKRLTILSSSE